MKLHRSTLFACALVLALVTPVMAAPAADKTPDKTPLAAADDGYGPRGPRFHTLPKEKQDAFVKIMQEFRDKTHPVREQLWIKQTTLRALSNNPKAEPQQIVTLVNEMSTLREQLYKERKAVAERIKKEVGIDLPSHGGYHKGPGSGGHDGGRHGDKGGGHGPMGMMGGGMMGHGI